MIYDTPTFIIMNDWDLKGRLIDSDYKRRISKAVSAMSNFSLDRVKNMIQIWTAISIWGTNGDFTFFCEMNRTCNVDLKKNVMDDTAKGGLGTFYLHSLSARRV